MTLTRRHFIGTTAATAMTGIAASSRRSSAQQARTPRNLVVIVAAGGWDTTYVFDPKPGEALVDAPEGELQSFADIDVLVSETRPQVTAFFERFADRTALVRGINVRSIVHPDCTRRMLTGTTEQDAPDMAAIAAFEQGEALPVPYLVLGSEAYPGPLAGISASMGFTGQIQALLSPQSAYPSPIAATHFTPSADEEDAIRRFVRARAERDQEVRGRLGYNRDRIADFLRSLDSGDILREKADELGPRGLTLSTAEQLELATTAIANELSWSVLVADRQMWDTHSDDAMQSQFHDGLFRDLLAFADDLAARPGKRAGSTMLDETVVAVVSEMSRTPRLNETGGKDHWPITTAMVFGGGIAGGRVHGATDGEMSARPIDLATGAVTEGGTYLEPGHLVAALLECVGSDSSAYLAVDPLRALLA